MEQRNFPRVTVTVEAINASVSWHPYPEHHDRYVELRIGQGKGAAIVRLEPEAACHLAYSLIEGARKIDLAKAKEEVWWIGRNEGYKERDREELRKKGAK
jgi:hypothetical protein